MLRDGELIAEARPGKPELEVPEPPGLEDARAASRSYTGFKNHRYSTCFVCGPDQEAGGLGIFAGHVPGRDMVASAWTPDLSLATEGQYVDPVFLWSVLDCPGGFAFPEPEEGSILLGELIVELSGTVHVAEPHLVIGWEFARDGRKHHTGTACFPKQVNVWALGGRSGSKCLSDPGISKSETASEGQFVQALGRAFRICHQVKALVSISSSSQGLLLGPICFFTTSC